MRISDYSSTRGKNLLHSKRHNPVHTVGTVEPRYDGLLAILQGHDHACGNTWTEIRQVTVPMID